MTKTSVQVIACVKARLRSLYFSPQFCSFRSRRSISRFGDRSAALTPPRPGGVLPQRSRLCTAAPGRRAVWPLSGSGVQSTRPFLAGKARRLWHGSTICSAVTRLSSRIRSLPPFYFPKRNNASRTPKARSGRSKAVSLLRRTLRTVFIPRSCANTGSAGSRSPAGQMQTRPFRARAGCACSFL